MDELDLVRLARPLAPEPDLTRLRVAALGGSSASKPVEPPPVEVPLVTIMPAPRHRRWRLAAAGLAAACLLVGGLTVALHRTGRSTAGPSDDVSLSLGLNGAWVRPIGGSIITVTFQAADGGAVTLEGPCGIYVSRGYRITDGRLHLGEPLSSPEAHCNAPSQASSIASLVTTLSSNPTIELGECTTPAVRTLTAVQTPDCSQLRIGDLTLFRAPATPATLAALDGHTFVLRGLSDGRGGTTAVRRIVRMTFVGARLDVLFDCNAGRAGVTLDRNVLVVGQLALADAPCGDDSLGAFEALLLDLPTVRLDHGGPLVLTAMDGRVAVLLESGSEQTTPPTTVADVGVPLPTTIAPPKDVLAELKGRWFTVSTWRDGSTTVVSGSRVRFDGDAVYIGCWHIAPARIENGRLLLGELTILKVACPEGADDRGALQMVLTGAPRIRIEGDVLTLATSDGLGAVLHETTGTPPPSTPTTISSTTTIAPADQVPTLEQLRGRVFVAQGSVAPVTLRLATDGTITASYGCNGGAIVAEIKAGHFVVSEWERTAKGCDDPLMAQDDAVVGMMTSSPTITLTGGRLTLSIPSLTLAFDEQLPAGLVGTRWTTNGRIIGLAVGFAGLRNVLRLNADGTWTFDGCGSGMNGRYTVAGSSLAFTFGPPASPGACATTTQADEVTAVVQMLQGPVTFAIGDAGLRLTGPDNNGEVFVAGP